MGTNYYWRTPDEKDDLHIGKSSSGWMFALHVDRDGPCPRNLLGWRQLWATAQGAIYNEYGAKIEVEVMLKIITHRKGRYEAGLPDPHLRRHPVDGRRCLGHGNGTWDELTGEFS